MAETRTHAPARARTACPASRPHCRKTRRTWRRSLRPPRPPAACAPRAPRAPAGTRRHTHAHTHYKSAALLLLFFVTSNLFELGLLLLADHEPRELVVRERRQRAGLHLGLVEAPRQSRAGCRLRGSALRAVAARVPVRPARSPPHSCRRPFFLFGVWPKGSPWVRPSRLSSVWRDGELNDWSFNNADPNGVTTP